MGPGEALFSFLGENLEGESFIGEKVEAEGFIGKPFIGDFSAKIFSELSGGENVPKKHS